MSFDDEYVLETAPHLKLTFDTHNNVIDQLGHVNKISSRPNGSTKRSLENEEPNDNVELRTPDMQKVLVSETSTTRSGIMANVNYEWLTSDLFAKLTEYTERGPIVCIEERRFLVKNLFNKLSCPLKSQKTGM